MNEALSKDVMKEYICAIFLFVANLRQEKYRLRQKEMDKLVILTIS